MKDSAYLQQLMNAYKVGIISEEENKELERLIREDNEARQAWEEFNKRFSEDAIHEKLKAYETDKPDPLLIIAEARRRLNRKRTVFYRLAGAAAAFILVASGSYYFFIKPKPGPYSIALTEKVSQPAKQVVLQLTTGQSFFLTGEGTDSAGTGTVKLNMGNRKLLYEVNDNASDKEVNGINRLTVPIGMDYQVTLSDGSRVWLNSATELLFPLRFSGQTREVTINGEAFLEVAKDAHRPFIVHSPKGDVQVLGTSFNINSYDTGTLKVALMEGAVRLTIREKEVSIHPGQEAVYMENRGIQIQPFDEDQVLSWRQGLFVFTEATLPEITAAIPRWYGIEVSVDNPKLRKERFSGVMDRRAPIRVFLDNLKTTMNISYEITQDSVLHIQ